MCVRVCVRVCTHTRQCFVDITDIVFRYSESTSIRYRCFLPHTVPISCALVAFCNIFSNRLSLFGTLRIVGAPLQTKEKNGSKRQEQTQNERHNNKNRIKGRKKRNYRIRYRNKGGRKKTETKAEAKTETKPKTKTETKTEAKTE